LLIDTHCNNYGGCVFYTFLEKYKDSPFAATFKTPLNSKEVVKLKSTLKIRSGIMGQLSDLGIQLKTLSPIYLKLESVEMGLVTCPECKSKINCTKLPFLLKDSIKIHIGTCRESIDTPGEYLRDVGVALPS
jgi:hypothetical protein